MHEKAAAGCLGDAGGSKERRDKHAHAGKSSRSSLALVTSTPAKMAAVSEMPGRRSASSSGGRWLRCRYTWSFSGPHPRPSRISIVMLRDTTSRDARSFAVGAYLGAAADAHSIGKPLILGENSPLTSTMDSYPTTLRVTLKAPRSTKMISRTLETARRAGTQPWPERGNRQPQTQSNTSANKAHPKAARYNQLGSMKLSQHQLCRMHM